MRRPATSADEEHATADAAAAHGTRRRLLIVVNVDWFFWSHRLVLAKAAMERGYDVTVATGVEAGLASRIEAEGLRFVPLVVGRGTFSPGADIRLLFQLRRLYRAAKPDIVHHITLKPVLFGSLAAASVGCPRVINALTGLGTVFSGRPGLGASLRASMVRFGLRRAFRASRAVALLQNPEDLDELVATGVVERRQTHLIRGSGVDVERFRPGGSRNSPPIVVMASRLIGDKGVRVFVDAARLVRARGLAARFVLVGAPDGGNPTAIPVSQLRSWEDEGVVEWWGRREDMPDVLRRATVVVLPTTYREGVPKILLEAAATGCPLVATDVAGCREICRDGETGLLVHPYDADATAEAIARLLQEPELRARLGRAGRALVEMEFSEAQVLRDTLGLYESLWSGVASKA
ncbi:MAG: glycosyltransferase [Luteitalea sp.]|nr:glycosyltransferase [Luteitalea sp.]